MKTIENNSLRLTDKEKKVTLYGWVQKKRDLGGVCFIDLRDRSGIVQLVARSGEVYEIASTLKNESVLKVEGIVRERESKNNNIATGDIEVELENIELLNSSRDLPFEITNTPCKFEKDESAVNKVVISAQGYKKLVLEVNKNGKKVAKRVRKELAKMFK